MNKIEYCTATGLLFVSEVPFTQETIERCQNAIDYGKSLPKEQFQFGIIIVDNVNGGTVIVGETLLNKMTAYIAANNLTIAKNEDFA